MSVGRRVFHRETDVSETAPCGLAFGARDSWMAAALGKPLQLLPIVWMARGASTGG